MIPGRGIADSPLCLPDRNGDGHPLFGNPAVRTFPEMVGRVPVGDANALAFADLDHDGDVDAVVVHTYGSSLFETSSMSVLLNDGDGVFELHGLYETPKDANHVALADLNGDGAVDAAVTCGMGADQLRVYLGNGAGVFPLVTVHPVGVEPTCVRAADVDCDGDLDLITLNQNSDDVSLLRNDGKANFALEVRFPAGPVPGAPFGFIEWPAPHFDVGDLDGDGDIDLAIPNTVKDVPELTRVYLLLNDGAGNFSPAAKHLQTGGRTYVVAVGDLDNDGKPDVAASTEMKVPDDRALSVFLNRSDVSVDPPMLAFDPPSLYPFVSGYESVYFTGLAIGDVTGDGYAEIVAAPAITYEGVSLYRNQGDGTFAPKQYEVSDSPKFIPFIKDSYFAALADVNGDGWLDLSVLSPWGRSTMRTALNDGMGNLLNDYRTPHALTNFCQGEECFQQWNGTDAGDIDGDGDIDLVVAQSNMEHSSQVKVLFNDGRARMTRIDSYRLEPLTEYGGNHLVLADLNGDRALDIVYVDPKFAEPGTLWTVFNRGDGTFSTGAKYPLEVHPGRIGTADFDGDGDLDVAMWAIQPYAGEGVPHARSVVWLRNDGGTLTAAQQVVFATLPWYATGGMAIADLNNDGATDVVVCERAWKQASQLIVMLNDGSGRFSVTSAYESPEGLNGLQVGDFDGDGKLDVLGAYTNAFVPTQRYLRVWRNDGKAGLTQILAIEDPQTTGVFQLAVGDIDGDGVPDAVTANYFGTVSVNLAILAGRAPQHYGTDAGCGSLCIADFDGDGRMDVSATNYLYGHVSIMLNRACPGPPPPPPPCDARPSSP